MTQHDSFNLCSEKLFWENRYENKETGWDIGYCSPPLRAIFEELDNRALKILIPGAGNAHEAKWLHRNGFTNVFVLDFAEQPVSLFEQSLPDFPKDHILLEDFFAHQGNYDLIIEQTFFCAIPPTWREKYAQKMSELLNPLGELRGVFFNREFENGPPFGGNSSDYLALFSTYFQCVEFEPCPFSIEPRSGNEIFARLSNPIKR